MRRNSIACKRRNSIQSIEAESNCDSVELATNYGLRPIILDGRETHTTDVQEYDNFVNDLRYQREQEVNEDNDAPFVNLYGNLFVKL